MQTWSSLECCHHTGKRASIANAMIVVDIETQKKMTLQQGCTNGPALLSTFNHDQRKTKLNDTTHGEMMVLQHLRTSCSMTTCPTHAPNSKKTANRLVGQDCFQSECCLHCLARQNHDPTKSTNLTISLKIRHNIHMVRRRPPELPNQHFKHLNINNTRI